jgi:hypothetical protein
VFAAGVALSAFDAGARVGGGIKLSSGSSGLLFSFSFFLPDALPFLFGFLTSTACGLVFSDMSLSSSPCSCM